MKHLFIISTIFILALGVLVVPTFAQKISTDSTNLNDKVNQKLVEAKQSPKAYIGTVTDKTDGGLQIKSTNGEIQQISVSSSASSSSSLLFPL